MSCCKLCRTKPALWYWCLCRKFLALSQGAEILMHTERCGKSPHFSNFYAGITSRTVGIRYSLFLFSRKKYPFCAVKQLIMVAVTIRLEHFLALGHFRNLWLPWRQAKPSLLPMHSVRFLLSPIIELNLRWSGPMSSDNMHSPSFFHVWR